MVALVCGALIDSSLFSAKRKCNVEIIFQVIWPFLLFSMCFPWLEHWSVFQVFQGAWEHRQYLHAYIHQDLGWFQTITFWHIRMLYVVGMHEIYFYLHAAQDHTGPQRTRHDWQANRSMPLWQPLTQPKIILAEPTEIQPQKSQRYKQQGNYKVWNEDQIQDESTGEERRGVSGLVHFGAHVGKSSATWQAKQTNKSQVKGGEIRGKSWHIPEVTACKCLTVYALVWLEAEKHPLSLPATPRLELKGSLMCNSVAQWIEKCQSGDEWCQCARTSADKPHSGWDLEVNLGSVWSLKKKTEILLLAVFIVCHWIGNQCWAAFWHKANCVRSQKWMKYHRWEAKMPSVNSLQIRWKVCVTWEKKILIIKAASK